jgi:serine/threonine protein kinase/Tfp pilus assembly protein PilF
MTSPSEKPEEANGSARKPEEFSPFLCSPPSPEAEPDDPRVIQALEEYAALLQAGRGPNRKEFLARYPGLTEVLTAGLDGLELLNAARPQLGGEDSRPGDGFSLDKYLVAPLGDFRLLREVGRGGMGVVYEAEQMSLGRRVALKVLPFAATLDPKQLQRFKNEAQAAALLQHQHIVPVYFVGCERGVHFYAMQFIEGQTLAAVIGELRRLAGKEEAGLPGSSEQLSAAARALAAGCLPEPGPLPPENQPTVILAPPMASSSPDTTPRANQSTDRSITNRAYFRTVARLGQQAAEALEHAHEMGVIHRDVKPANLLIDARANVWITDFGLAHCQNQTGLTMTGDFVGTLRYVSPEQALAKPGLVDQRTDVYSLGATLYELLTLRPVFDGSDRQELLRQIAFEEPRRPRSWNRAIPLELETIVRKALEKNPVDRYATAQALADDLGRFLRDEAIQARPPTLLQRLRKWMRRHQAIVTAAFLSLVLAVIVLSIATVTIARARNEIQIERDRADARSRQARRAVDQMFVQVAEKWLSLQVRLEPVQEEFLRKALALYEEFTTEESSDPQAQFERGRAFRRIGDVRRRLARLTQAEEAYREAIAILKNLAEEHPDRPDYREELAFGHNNLGTLLAHVGQRTQAEKEYREGLALRAQLAAEFPTEAKYAWQNAASHNHLGNLLKAGSNYGGAEQAYRQGLTLIEPWVAKPGATPPLRLQLAHLCQNLHILLSAMGQFPEAEKSLKRAIVEYEKLVQEFPADPIFRLGLAGSQTSLGVFLEDLRREQDAEIAYGSAIAVMQKLAEDFPLIPDYRWRLAQIQNNLGTLFMQEKPDKAREAFEQALPLYERLVQQHPRFPEYGHELAKTRRNLGLLMERLGKPNEAENLTRRAVAVLEPLVAEFPETPIYRYELARTYVRHGDLLRILGRRKEADEVKHKGEELHKRLAAESSSIKDTRYEQALDHLKRASQLHQTGPFDEEERAIRQAQALLVDLTTEFPAVAQYRAELARANRDLADTCAKRGHPQEAVQAGRKSVDAFEQLAADFPDRRDYALGQADSLLDLAVVLGGWQKFEEAEKALKRAIAILEPRTEKDPKWTNGRRSLARSYDNLGMVYWHQDRLADRADAHRQGLEERQRLAAEMPQARDVQEELAGSHLNLSGALMDMGQLDQAEEHLHQALPILRRLVKDQPLLPRYRDTLGIGVSKRGNLMERKNKLEEALGQYREGAVIYLALVRDFPDVPEYRLKAAAMHGNAALMLVRMGRFAEARKLYERALEVGPDQFFVHENLSEFLSTCPDPRCRDPQKALEHARKAIELAPERGDCWRVLGMAHYRAEEWKEAVTALEKAEKLLGKDADSREWFFLAMAHWQLGRKEEARKWYDRAVQDPGIKNAQAEDRRRFRSEAAALLGNNPSPVSKDKNESKKKE